MTESRWMRRLTVSIVPILSILVLSGCQVVAERTPLVLASIVGTADDRVTVRWQFTNRLSSDVWIATGWGLGKADNEPPKFLVPPNRICVLLGDIELSEGVWADAAWGTTPSLTTRRVGPGESVEGQALITLPFVPRTAKQVRSPFRDDVRMTGGFYQIATNKTKSISSLFVAVQYWSVEPYAAGNSVTCTDPLDATDRKALAYAVLAGQENCQHAAKWIEGVAVSELLGVAIPLSSEIELNWNSR